MTEGGSASGTGICGGEFSGIPLLTWKLPWFIVFRHPRQAAHVARRDNGLYRRDVYGHSVQRSSPQPFNLSVRS